MRDDISSLHFQVHFFIELRLQLKVMSSAGEPRQFGAEVQYFGHLIFFNHQGIIPCLKYWTSTMN
jgi:hypothetical protein